MLYMYVFIQFKSDNHFYGTVLHHALDIIKIQV